MTLSHENDLVVLQVEKRGDGLTKYSSAIERYNLYYDGDEFHEKVKAILKSKHGEGQGLTLDNLTRFTRCIVKGRKSW